MTIESDAKRLAEVNQRGDIIRQTTKTVSAEIRVLVDKLLADHPDHNKTIRRCLEGESHRLLSQAEAAKQKAFAEEQAKETAAKIKAANIAKRKKKKS